MSFLTDLEVFHLTWPLAEAARDACADPARWPLDCALRTRGAGPWRRPRPPGLSIADRDGDVDLLSDDEDLNRDASLLEPGAARRLARSLEVLTDLAPAGFALRLFWGGDKVEQTAVVTLADAVAALEAGDGLRRDTRTIVAPPPREHRFSWWHQGVFLVDRAYAFSDGRDEYVEATADGGPFGQSASGGVTFVSPGGAAFSASDVPLTVEVHPTPPAADGEADSVGEFELALTSGELVLEESGGGDHETVVLLPPGHWRARWSGFGEAAAEELERSEDPPAARPDRYRIDLWPRSEDAPLVVHRG